MAIVVAVTNQKGGVGKTTSALCLADGLKNRGYRVLLIDTDQQQSSTKQYKAVVQDTYTLYDVLTGACELDSAIQKLDRGDIVAADDLLKKIDVALEGMKKYLHMKKAIQEMKTVYDFIILDCPPALDTVLLNNLTACDRVLVPITCEIMSLEGLTALSSTLDSVREVTNPNIKVVGLLLIKYKKHTRLTKQLTAQLEVFEDLFDTKTFRSRIRESTALAEAQTLRQSVFEYAPKSTTAQDYDSFVDEFLSILGGEDNG